MKALTLWQPWASLVALGVKTIETRAWGTSYRGPLAIHAAARKPDVEMLEDGLGGEIWDDDDCLVQWGQTDKRDFYPDRVPVPGERWWLTLGPDHRFCRPMPLGAVVATCTLIDCVPMVDGCSEPLDHGYPYLKIWGDGVLGIVRRPDEIAEWVTDQGPYGDFASGRWAWLLEDVNPVDPPLPARGRQQLWEWDKESLHG